MHRHLITILFALGFLNACDQAEQKTAQDNILLKKQEETVHKAEKALNSGLDQQNAALESAGEQ
ncbi:hypothetical protein [Dichelobacter nodosus]|uniref:Hypothetical lipoprotein n=1 Tax=Dichelobacter nodosus (strain VCS1703A) TaxID=246195 RepID=A5EVY9_DICNV|nr:hypothetical protein [Dichelobacter nodosus]ABQ13533.1 hypothetical lipoprotein [Dichelobacter nodosus VCS1703A]AXM45292.1 hypothetical protein DYQ38_01970 [Dichelobacter nodosus]KNZ40086.1 hypothetical protein AKG33_00525 [Dichelobacter nodosus]TGA66119.1 hypothetical protein E5E99_01710 [Dichelobacter nodosus]